MNLKRLSLYTLIAGSLLGGISCESPMKDFDLQISTEVIKHSATLEVLDVDGNPVSNVAIKLVSGDTQDIYNTLGVKSFKLTGNLVTFGLDPKRKPTAAQPVIFFVEISGADYLTQVVPVLISDVSTGIQPVRLVKPSALPEGVTQIIENVPLGTNGTLAAPYTITATDDGTDQEVQITIPAGTQFRDAAGNIVTGTSLSVQVTIIDPTNPDALPMFPGGALSIPSMTGPNGTNVAGVFNPAGTVTIVMSIGGVQVTQFSNPIQVVLDLDEDFTFTSTGQPLTAGSVLQLWSNTPSDPVWKYEQLVTVTGSAATGFKVAFSVDHLTTYAVVEWLRVCGPLQRVNFTADWITQGFTYPVTIEVHLRDHVISTRTFSVSETNKSVDFFYLPFDETRIVVKNTAGDIIAEAAYGVCGAALEIELVDPTPPEPKVTLQLYVRCPDKATTITLLPTFQLYYRVANTGTFEYLGEVSNGFLQSALLKSDGTKYDFRAVWNERVKTVVNKTVDADNSATVGIQPGDIMGVKGGATNLAMLTEECGKL